MNKIKLLLLLLMAVTGMAAFADDASFEFVESDGGQTLTIRGYGNLTTASKTVTEKVFAAAANGNIFTDDNGTSVTSQAAYNPSATYYYADREYTQVFDGGAPSAWSNGVGNISISWNEAATTADGTYIYPAYLNGDKVVINGDRITSGYPNYYNKFQYNGNTYVEVVKLSSTAYFGELIDVDESILFTEAQLNNYKTIEYSVINDNLYRSQDGGATKQKLTNGQTYTYKTGDKFYTAGGATYTQIADNATFFAAHPAYLEDAEVTATFKEALLAKINNGAYTKVAFDNIGSGELTIDPEIVQQILYPYDEANNTITELDLGEATTNTVGSYDLTSMYGYTISTFEDLLSCPAKGWIYPESLAKLTLPLVAKDGDEMVLPAMMSVPENLTTVTVPQGYTKIGNAAFLELGGSEVAKINLPEGLKEIGNRSFISNVSLKEINITGAEQADRKLVLPSTLEVIQDDAFRGCELLSSTEDDPFILPASLKKIGIGAFYNLTQLKFLQLNEGLEYVGNSAFGLTSKISDQTAITFPSTIKYLGPGSFVERWYQDIYFTSEKAPVCPVGQGVYQNSWGAHVTAFSNEIHMGNNGFNPNGAFNGSTADDTSEGYANRENYVNGGTNNEDGGYYFTELHYPTDTSAENEMTYKDITRRYVTGTWDGEGGFSYSGYGSAATFAHEKDPLTSKEYGEAFLETTTLSYGNYTNYCTSTNLQPGFIDTYQGKQTVWPSQAQWMRYYIMVANGLSWDGVTEYRPEVTEEMFKMMKEDGLMVSQDSDEAGINLEDINSFNDLTTNQKNYLSKILYQGTRRFVLGYDSPYEIPFKLELEAGRWWSICLPFNMTKKQIDEVFGVGTHVCLFSGVKRTDGDDKLLRLEFINDVYHHKTERTVEKLNNGKALQYTYGANYSTSNPEPADDEIVIYARESYMIYPTKENDDASEKAIRNFGTPDFAVGDPLPTMIQANSETPYTIDGSDVAYRFIGNFTTNASYDAETNKLVPVKIPRYSYAYGQSGGVTKFFILDSDKAVWTPFKSIVQNLGRDGGLDDWNNYFKKASANVKQMSVFGLEEDITGVENVIIEASSDNGADKAVYNINGSYVGDSLQGLAPGVYVQQGKAYIVE